MRMRGRISFAANAAVAAAGLALLLAAGSAQAQDIRALPNSGAASANAPGQTPGERQCLTQDELAAAQKPKAPENAAPSFLMPTTGLAFTLPPLEEEASPLPECPPASSLAPVRPPAPDIFGFSAVPIGSALRGDWDAEQALSLDGRRGLWDELLLQAQAQTGETLLDTVNRWVNSHMRYLEDRYGDHWADARDTLRNGYGDCEDYAIAKMALLAKLGVSENDMFLVVLRDKQQLDHAILAVRSGGEMFVLDNRIDTLRRAEEIDEYLPTLSYSGSFGWTYGRSAAPRQRAWGSPLSAASQ